MTIILKSPNIGLKAEIDWIRRGCESDSPRRWVFRAKGTWERQDKTVKMQDTCRSRIDSENLMVTYVLKTRKTIFFDDSED
jgi:hypothetical protein